MRRITYYFESTRMLRYCGRRIISKWNRRNMVTTLLIIFQDVETKVATSVTLQYTLVLNYLFWPVRYGLIFYIFLTKKNGLYLSPLFKLFDKGRYQEFHQYHTDILPWLKNNNTTPTHSPKRQINNISG